MRLTAVIRYAADAALCFCSRCLALTDRDLGAGQAVIDELREQLKQQEADLTKQLDGVKQQLLEQTDLSTSLQEQIGVLKEHVRQLDATGPCQIMWIVLTSVAAWCG